MSAIVVENIYKTYDTMPVLERVNLDISSGTFCTIVGASGCGKSTFLRILLGQEVQTSGEIRIDDEQLTPEPNPDRGIVFQRYSVFPNLSVADNLMLAADLMHGSWRARTFGRQRREAREKARHLLDRIGLAEAAGRYPAQLSGGMQQRLAIAQTLMNRPKVLLLDEPFGALDPGVRDDMQELLHEIWLEEKMTVFMVTHDISEAFKLGTRLIVFDKVRADPEFPEAYGATITYDLDVSRKSDGQPGDLPDILKSRGTEEPTQ